MSRQQVNMYQQKGCVGCKLCEGGAAKIGRTSALWGIGLFTGGLGLIVLPFFKKCVYCNHNMFLNKHSPYDEYPSPPQMTNQPQTQQPTIEVHINQGSLQPEKKENPYPSRVEAESNLPAPEVIENPYPSRINLP